MKEKESAASKQGAPAALMPALFFGHGSPMNAVEDNEFTRGWAQAASAIARPRAVLCVSAHWETRGVAMTTAPTPETVHDFYGFPPELSEVRYPAPGEPALAQEVRALLKKIRINPEPERGLDHGCWSVLKAMYPQADVPVVQMSLDTSQQPAFHYALASELAPLRERGVLIIGSGNIVHNLRLMKPDLAKGFDWAARINAAIKSRVIMADHAKLMSYATIDPDMRLAVPTPEHFLPLLYVLGARRRGEEAVFFNDKVVMGSVSMTCVRVG
jgi:4,5-DOPA dioxygenase extradiol